MRTAELRELQELVYAAETHALLVVLQGMDAAGKDVTIANVFAVANPQSCRVVEYKKAPTFEEERHDVLWRAHAPMPRRDEMVIFDRSYYERVVTDRVTGDAATDVVRRRYGHINAFEELLVDRHPQVLPPRQPGRAGPATAGAGERPRRCLEGVWRQLGCPRLVGRLPGRL